MINNPVISRPGTPDDLDRLIEENGGTSSALELHFDKTQQSKDEIRKKDQLLDKVRDTQAKYMLHIEIGYLRRRVLAITREASSLRPEIAYLRGHRRVARTLFARNTKAFLSYKLCLEKPHTMLTELSGLFDSLRHDPSLYTKEDGTLLFRQLSEALETCNQALRDVFLFAEKIQKSSEEFMTCSRLLEEDWIKCIENKI